MKYHTGGSFVSLSSNCPRCQNPLKKNTRIRKRKNFILSHSHIFAGSKITEVIHICLFFLFCFLLINSNLLYLRGLEEEERCLRKSNIAHVHRSIKDARTIFNSTHNPHLSSMKSNDNSIVQQKDSHFLFILGKQHRINYFLLRFNPFIFIFDTFILFFEISRGRYRHYDLLICVLFPRLNFPNI